MIRPVDADISQRYGDNPTKDLPADSWLIKTFGNYQPDGHSGEDYACPVGSPVRAVASGTVLHIGWMGGTYADNPWWVAPNFAGYVAVIDHGAFIGIYGHCQDGSAKVTKGDRVTEGQVFVLSGNTGGSTGPHLHFEILPDGYILGSRMYGRIDPEPLFTGAITTQSATITPLEDDVSAQEVLSWPIERTDGQQSTVAVELAKIGPDLAKLDGIAAALARIESNTTESMLNDRKQVYSLDALRAAPPAQLAADINAAGLASAVRDELVKLLGGK